jgi:hypothetical protein
MDADRSDSALFDHRTHSRTSDPRLSWSIVFLAVLAFPRWALADGAESPEITVQGFVRLEDGRAHLLVRVALLLLSYTSWRPHDSAKRGIRPRSICSNGVTSTEAYSLALPRLGNGQSLNDRFNVELHYYSRCRLAQKVCA